MSAPASLLGRLRVRERLATAKAEGKFSDMVTRWARFADAPLGPMEPSRAVEYFLGLEPELGVDPKRFAADQRRRAFTLSLATERGLLDRVQRVVAEVVRTGDTRSGTAQVARLLEEAGVSPRNPGYANLVVRTNVMDALVQGQEDEFADPAVRAYLSHWRYDGILDGRQGKDHEIHFGRIFPATVPFRSVRGPRVWNCRCVGTPLSIYEVEDLRAQGVKIEG